ncbi:MAG: HlyD family efflux transporter periplasmic adaptor subunit [Clostridiales bacterium]|nr:HlyD family efflux transporter periplasmic adaptor subunit [Clostridiales bacterium]
MEESKKKKNRRWVTRGMIAFVAILALLTFFSNTVMNMTIPKVIGKQAVRGNLSQTNNATGTIESTDKQDVKGIDGRVVDSVNFSNYNEVQAGDVILTLRPPENTDSLDELRTRLTALQREVEYADRTPATTTDYTALREAVNTAQENLELARATLSQAQNRDATIAAAQAIINENSPLVPGLEASVSAAAETVESIQGQISQLQSEIDSREEQIATLINLGVPTPTPTPVPGMLAARPVRDIILNEETTPDTTDTTDTNPSESTPSETTPSTGASSDPSETAPTETTPAPTSAANSSTERIGVLRAEIEEREQQISELTSQLSDATARRDEASANLAAVNGAIEEATAAITAAGELPSVSSAQSSVNLAESSVNTARTTLNNTQITDEITREQAADTRNDKLEQIAQLERQIAEMEARLEVVEITAPVSGYLFNVSVSAGDTLSKDTVAFTVVPYDSQYTVTFKFSSEVAQTLSAGMPLTCDAYWINSVIITTINPDPDDPRGSRLVKCALSGDYMFPGESITVVADRSNKDYEHVIPSSAINEDNTGHFVYVIEESSSPLGDKYVVKRVDVTVEATDGALTAISGEGIDRGMIVTRSEEPLHDGDRVRLEDYS